MSTSDESSQRDKDLRAIQATYDGYRLEGRHRLWTITNPGFARMMRDRDRVMLDLLRRSLPAHGAAVLDLGSGDGRLAGTTRDAGLTVDSWTGVDLDPESVHTAASAYPWATFVEASADALPFGDAAFDVVVTSTIFSSLPSEGLEEAVAAETARVLRPGGWILWYDIRYNNPGNARVHAIGRRRLADLFPDWLTELKAVTLIPPIARRLGQITPLAYGPLESIPLLRSHLIGRLQRP
jgi:SAM-dependent methyltransferase